MSDVPPTADDHGFTLAYATPPPRVPARGLATHWFTFAFSVIVSLVWTAVTLAAAAGTLMLAVGAPQPGYVGVAIFAAITLGCAAATRTQWAETVRLARPPAFEPRDG